MGGHNQKHDMSIQFTCELISVISRSAVSPK
jgi:hypothetical protein